jgi:hypothetical protein
MHLNFIKNITFNHWRQNALANPVIEKVNSLKIHKCSEDQIGKEFVIEPFEEHEDIYIMTSQKLGIKSCQYILIQGKSKQKIYKVLEIDYYCGGLPGMWIAKLALEDIDNWLRV